MSMFLDVTDPLIPGETECKDPKFAAVWDKKIAIEFMAYSVSQAVASGIGGGLSAGGANVSHMQVTKEMDKSTPILFGHLAAGIPINKMFIRISRPGAASSGGKLDGLFEAETYEMHNVIVSSYHTSGAASGGGMPTEDWSFSFTEIKESYKLADKRGVVQNGDPPSYGYSFGTGSQLP